MQRIGPRMRELLHIVARHPDGVAPSRRTAYMRLGDGTYDAESCGDGVMRRLERHGLVERLPSLGKANHIPVRITRAGRRVLAEEAT